jgi:hypothetical protein
MRILAYILHYLISHVKSKIIGAVHEPPLHLFDAEPALLSTASGVASADADIVLFSQLILTIRGGNGEGDCVVTVSGICVGRALLGAIAAVVEVPGPGGYIACRLIDEVNDGSPCA